MPCGPVRQARAGLVPRFRRLAIETTGLADPAPIVSTLMAEPVLRHHFRLGTVVTTVDAVNGELHLARNPESAKQIAIADRLVLTKGDLASAERVERLRRDLRRLNPSAAVIDLAHEPLDPDDLMAGDVYDPARKDAEVRRWLEAAAAEPPDRLHVHDRSRHDRDIQTFCLTFGSPLDWTAFGLWLTMLLHVHGNDVLRVKAILNVVDLPVPVVIHGVQHVVHPPVHLDRWPSGDHRSRLVMIVRGLDRAALEDSLATFNGLTNPDR